MLISMAASDMDEGELFVSVGGESDYRADVMDFVTSVVDEWKAADGARTPVPQRPEMDEAELAASVDRGRALFHGVVANCSKCHGETALGDGVQDDYDEWTKELEPKDPERVAEYMELGALKPRNIIPRNLRMNVFRGGRRPIDIYTRIVNGIAGSGMPAAALAAPGEPPSDKKLTTDQVWDIVNYVYNLPYEYASEPPQRQPAYRRDRL
jgi:mono/diheme cytochrome c family protein